MMFENHLRRLNVKTLIAKPHCDISLKDQQIKRMFL